MKKETLEMIMKKHYIYDNEEAMEAIEFVMELLEEERDYIEKTEPYAKKTIDGYEKAYRIVRDLQDNYS